VASRIWKRVDVLSVIAQVQFEKLSSDNKKTPKILKFEEILI
jgi:hypothetical protein